MRTTLTILITFIIADATFSQGFRPPFGGGGPPPGRMGGFRPEDLLRRIDQNGNGVLEPSETEGRARYFLERIVRDVPGLDLNQPIPIDRLGREMERLREQRYGGSSRSRDSSSGSNAGSSQPKEKEPLVLGFGLDEEPPAVPGFGEDAELFAVEVTGADRREAQERFRRYDRNNDGKLAREEIAGGRWYDDPFQYDRNRDNALSVEELAVRYARRRIDRAAQSTSSSSESGGSSYSRRDDDNERRRSWFGRSSDGDSGRSSSRKKEDPRRSYRLSTAADRLPKGLPDWFTRADANSDGQVMMFEFATAWSDSLVADFLKFDLNQDGVVTPQECLQAAKSGATRGGESGIGFQPVKSGDDRLEAYPTTPSVAADDVSIDPKSLEFFTKVVNEADENGDGELTPDEWSKMSRDPAAADRDGNGRITPLEYARWRLNK